MEKNAANAISEMGEAVEKGFGQFMGGGSRVCLPMKQSPGTCCEFSETDSPWLLQDTSPSLPDGTDGT